MTPNLSSGLVALIDFSLAHLSGSGVNSTRKFVYNVGVRAQHSGGIVFSYIIYQWVSKNVIAAYIVDATSLNSDNLISQRDIPHTRST